MKPTRAELTYCVPAMAKCSAFFKRIAGFIFSDRVQNREAVVGVRRLARSAFILLTAINISSAHADEPEPAAKCKILRVAEHYVAIHYPDFDSLSVDPMVRDYGDRWVVHLPSPELAAAVRAFDLDRGVVLFIDKTTLTVGNASRGK